MSIRTTRKIVKFTNPFTREGFGGVLPADNYEVVTDEELIEGLSFPVYRRVATIMLAPTQSSHAPSVEMLTSTRAISRPLGQLGEQPAYRCRPYRRHCRFLRHQGRGSMGPGRCLAARPLPRAAGTGAVFHYTDHRHHSLLDRHPGDHLVIYRGTHAHQGYRAGERGCSAVLESRGSDESRARRRRLPRCH